MSDLDDDLEEEEEEVDSEQDGWGNDEDPYTEDEKDQAGSSEFFNSYD